MSEARAVEVMDAAAAYLRAAWVDAATLAVETDPDPDIDLTDPASLPRRTAFLFVEGFGQVEMTDRTHDTDEYRLSVVVAELYGGEAAKAPKAWVRERVAWVDRYVRKVLGDNRAQAEPGGEIIPGSGIWPESVSVEVAYDLDHLAEHKLFFSVVVAVFREIVEA